VATLTSHIPASTPVKAVQETLKNLQPELTDILSESSFIYTQLRWPCEAGVHTTLRLSIYHQLIKSAQPAAVLNRKWI